MDRRRGGAISVPPLHLKPLSKITRHYGIEECKEGPSLGLPRGTINSQVFSSLNHPKTRNPQTIVPLF